VVSYFSDDANIAHIRRLLNSGIRIEGGAVKSNSLSGKVFVVTGTLKGLARSEVKELIAKNGGRLASAISAGTDYLVVGESPGTKLQKAKDMGITTINEEEFLELLKKWNLLQIR
jgi:DNA ligase (NAD+)